MHKQTHISFEKKTHTLKEKQKAFLSLLSTSSHSRLYCLKALFLEYNQRLLFWKELRTKMEGGVASYVNHDLNLKATELRLGLPGTDGNEEHAVPAARNNKRPLMETHEESAANGKSELAQKDDTETAPAPKLLGKC
ncbi:hypothetical protein Tsubulata_012550 [Turnera subulata]|uniref:Uncharacterized protein n=1 Tax=Turnera subulata TaxID=218843 RepID=A0A9Q0GA32_9ROSI|nr:hypothetical protein Tsubulata_012550 [Turnera subulata]